MAQLIYGAQERSGALARSERARPFRLDHRADLWRPCYGLPPDGEVRWRGFSRLEPPGERLRSVTAQRPQ
jgi:hypothetical protein